MDEKVGTPASGEAADQGSLWDWIKAREGQEAPSAREHREPDYGAADYLELPDFGIGHYSLVDAALLAALDMWSSGAVPGVPCESWLDEQDDPKVRTALEPLRERLLSALTRSVEAGHLKAEVRGRSFPDSRLIADRTFVIFGDLVDWLEVHGHERGDLIADIEESLADEPWEVASQVAEARAHLRLSHLVVEPDVSQDESLDDAAARDLEGMKRELRKKRLHIAHLEQQLHGARGGGGSEERLTTRQRRTLLTVIAALCQKAGIDPKSRGAATTIASATAELGTPVSDDSIRSILRGIPDALEARSR